MKIKKIKLKFDLEKLEERFQDLIKRGIISKKKYILPPVINTRDHFGRCPKCQYPQYNKLETPTGIKPYKHVGDYIICPNCGFKASCDWWEMYDEDCYEELNKNNEGK